jgi:hypothetical protein
VTKLADYSWVHPKLESLKKLGFSGILRYVSRDMAKCVTRSEIAWCQANGFGLGLVFEDFTSRCLQGAHAGVEDALFSRGFLQGRGLPVNLYFAIDTDVDASSVRPYFAGITSVIGKQGVYGSYRVVDALVGGGICSAGWQTAAWSHGQWSVHAGILQVEFGNAWDTNQVAGPWLNVLATNQPPKEEVEDMWIIQREASPECWLVTGAKVVPLMARDLDQLRNAGVKTVVLAPETFACLTNRKAL